MLTDNQSNWGTNIDILGHRGAMHYGNWNIYIQDIISNKTITIYLDY